MIRFIDHPEPDLDYVCTECGAKFGELPTDDDDIMLCENCFTLDQCAHCGHWFEELDGNMLCENCTEHDGHSPYGE